MEVDLDVVEVDRVVLDNSSKTLESQYLSIIQIQYHAKDGLRNHI